MGITITQAEECERRQPGESSRAFAAYLAYKGQGAGRSYAKVARELGKSKTLIDRWGSKYRWMQRIFAFERHEELQRQEADRKALLGMKIRHLSIARAAQEKIVQRLTSLDAEKIPLGDLPKWLAVAVTVERTAYGLDASMKMAAVEQGEIMRPEGSILDDRLRELSAIDRSLLRDIALKKMRIMALEAEVETGERETAAAAGIPIDVKAIAVFERPKPVKPEVKPDPADEVRQRDLNHPTRALAPSRF